MGGHQMDYDNTQEGSPHLNIDSIAQSKHSNLGNLTHIGLGNTQTKVSTAEEKDSTKSSQSTLSRTSHYQQDALSNDYDDNADKDRKHIKVESNSTVQNSVTQNAKHIKDNVNDDKQVRL